MFHLHLFGSDPRGWGLPLAWLILLRIQKSPSGHFLCSRCSSALSTCLQSSMSKLISLSLLQICSVPHIPNGHRNLQESRPQGLAAVALAPAWSGEESSGIHSRSPRFSLLVPYFLSCGPKLPSATSSALITSANGQVFLEILIASESWMVPGNLRFIFFGKRGKHCFEMDPCCTALQHHLICSPVL